MTREVTLRQAGGSVSATLPKEMADRLRLEAGAAKKYRNALRELAN
jgi:hypothetical protein